MSFKAKKGKNKYNMMGWRIKRSQVLKIIFVAIKAKTLARYGQKVDFLIQPSVTNVNVYVQQIQIEESMDLELHVIM